MKKKKFFCAYCGGKLSVKTVEGKSRDYCPSCDLIHYENPLPVASAILVNEKREVLLVKRKNEPYRNMWCLPIGFAETNEEVRDAALRELKEETGVLGEIVRLIDVDTVDNYFYGNLAIVTYEVRMMGGSLAPGDDALEATFFPVHDVPPLAWTSNEKAIGIYIDIYSDSWAMIDSFRRLFPEMNGITDVPACTDEQKSFLSNAMIQIIEKNLKSISNEWIREVNDKLPVLSPHSEYLMKLYKSILIGVQFWLESGTDTYGIEDFFQIGTELKKLDVPLPEVITALALGRKSIWTHMVRERYMLSPLEIYSTVEINNRIIYYFDKIMYYLTSGYFSRT